MGDYIQMKFTSKLAGAAGALAMLAAASATPASAQSLFPADAKLEWSVNGGVMSDYVFRGQSQNDEDPSFFAGADVTYGIFYAGIWAAMVDPAFVGGASAEIDYYAGITPKLGPATFDFGVIVYHYPNSDAGASDGVDYVELKAGVSGEIVKGLNAGATYYYSPDYTFASGETHTFEGTLGYTFDKIGIFEPTIDGTVGHITGEQAFTDYTYWNAGIALAVENLTLDFRYWDTDTSVLSTSADNPGADLADERFVFTATLALP